jgi:CDP-glucose 4,6-dehydratase
MINASFWNGKKVFITGHTGFKGGWLTFWLNMMGAKVTGYSLPAPTTPSFFDAVNLSSICNHQIGDIRDYALLNKCLQDSQAEIVFHMAAQPLVRKSYRDPLETYSTNVMGTANLLQALRENNTVKSCIIITTDKCYENNEWDWGYRENDRLGGHDPYSNSKACTELVTAAFYKSFFQTEKKIGLATVRAGNVIGGGDFADDRLIPDIYRAIQNQVELKIRYPQSTRPWQHVLVPLSGYLQLAEKNYAEPELYSEPFNFGPKDEDCISVGELVKECSKAWGVKLPVVLENNQMLHEAKFLKLDISKAANRLKWHPLWNVNRALQESAIWYKSFRENKNMAEVTRKQISDFLSV